jgi:hypothetical protein
MKPENIQFLMDSNPSVQMIRLRNANWVFPFLFQVFKAEELKSVIPEEQLILSLSDALQLMEEKSEDYEEAQIIYGEDDIERSRKYISTWVQKRILQDFQDNNGVVQYQLSAYTEKVFQWLQSLQTRKHVGTESRFTALFTSLQDIIEHSEDDKAKRIELLKAKRAEIDKEIKAIELGIAPETYSNAQVRERLETFTRTSYELLSDFREVEDHFKQIHRSIVEQHTRLEQQKGAIVGYAFEAYDGLRHSDQGKSFYAFWDFLISRVGQEEWNELSDKLIHVLQDREIAADIVFIRNIKSLLWNQGKTVYQANDKMAEKLSRIISEKEITKHRRLRKQIASVKELLFNLIDEEQVSCELFLEDGPDMKMVMDRRLVTEDKKVLASLKQPIAGVQHIADPERFGRMFNHVMIDKKKLWQKVVLALQQKETASLKEILELSVPEQGLVEIITFFSFTKDKPGKVQIINNLTELIPLYPSQTKFVEVPYLLFGK